MVFIGDPFDGLYEDTIKALKRLKPNRKGKVESWDMYQFLFPEDLTYLFRILLRAYKLGIVYLYCH